VSDRSPGVTFYSHQGILVGKTSPGKSAPGRILMPEDARRLLRSMIGFDDVAED
jgi:hypothetical protein